MVRRVARQLASEELALRLVACLLPSPFSAEGIVPSLQPNADPAREGLYPRLLPLCRLPRAAWPDEPPRTGHGEGRRPACGQGVPELRPRTLATAGRRATAVPLSLSPEQVWAIVEP